MTTEDVDEAAAVFLASILAVIEAYPRPGEPTFSAREIVERRGRLADRIAHMLGTDPDGAWVAVDGERVVGIAHAVRREGLWVLSLLGVAGDHQDKGVGKELIGRTLDYGDRNEPGLIYSSPDPRAMHRYVRSGFALHPAIEAVGRVRRGSFAPVAGVRPGDDDDLALVAHVDRHLRGASHGPDIDYALRRGARLLVAEDSGYAVVTGPQLLVLGAIDDDGAKILLRCALAEMTAPGDDVGEVGAFVDVSVDWLTAGQQWAFDVCTESGLDLYARGAVMVRGDPGPLTPYVPSGGFG